MARLTAFAGRFINQRWFPLADLGLVALSGVIWNVFPQASWWPLVLALFPWVARFIGGQAPFKRTIFDIPLSGFLVSAVVGVWAAYDHESAWSRFWLIIGAVLLYYAVAGQPRSNLWLVASCLSILTVFVAGSLLLFQEWGAQTADLAILERLGRWWVAVRPPIPTRVLPNNVMGGILALLIPFPFAVGLRACREMRVKVSISTQQLISILALGLAGFGLLLTSSRGAWLALAAATGTWIFWSLCRQIARSLKQPQGAVVTLTLLVITGPVLWLARSYPGGLFGLVNRLPGLPTGGSRLELALSSLHLITDFPISGGGLEAFPGLYSYYIKVIPFFYYSYSHNFFLDVALAQGVIGFLALAITLFGSAWLLITRTHQIRDLSHRDLLVWALLSSLIVLCLHGLVDDALYANQGTLLLFVLPGIIIALTQPGSMHPDPRFSQTAPVEVSAGSQVSAGSLSSRRLKLVAGSLAVLGLMAILTAFRNPLGAAWYANLGAVEMARVELAGFPTGRWSDGSNIAALEPAEALFTRALDFNPNNRTAHHRLGLIALLRQNFPIAVDQLEKALQLDKKHAGILKNLAYSYVWAGKIEKAVPLMIQLPEAEHEMRVYIYWWRNLGREDLAASAEQAVAKLWEAKTLLGRD